MKYFSTRGGTSELTFEDTVLTGLAPNGGLYIPTHIPSLPADWRTTWSTHTFHQLAVAVLALFTDIPTGDLEELVQRSYAGFREEDVVPLRRMHSKAERERWVLELWHGPTWAFKDVALQLLGNLFEYFLQKRNRERGGRGERERERLTIVGATSGDTGSAAIYGLRGKADISIFILHPKGRVSPVQEAQMTTVTDANVHNVAVKGTFDDCQDIVKALFADKDFNAKHHLGAVNSINWARILAQTVYYFHAYFVLRRATAASAPEPTPPLQFVVPTGNFGDVLAGYFAKRMGLPIQSLVVATNENDILARFWRSGTLAPGTAGVKATLSPAMDITVSSNFERLLWYLAAEEVGGERGPACEMVSRWMAGMKSDGKVEVPVRVLEAARRDFVAERISDGQTLECIRETYAESRYVVDPHTAVGIAAAKIVAKNANTGVTQIILSTAHPAKFSEAVTRALRAEPDFDFDRDVLPEDLKDLLNKARRVIDVDTVSVDAIKKVIESKS